MGNNIFFYEQMKIKIFQSKSWNTEIQVRLEEETVWLNQNDMSILFWRNQSVISRHIKNIFKENELEEKSNMHFLHIPNSDKPVAFYNLDMIISVWYRVNSWEATKFRIWATSILKSYPSPPLSYHYHEISKYYQRLWAPRDFIVFFYEREFLAKKSF